MTTLEKNPNAYQWIITFNNEDIGHIKIIDLVFGSSLKDDFQGKGIGKKAYFLVFNEAKNLGLTKVKASVRLDRSTPIKFEEDTGWRKLGLEYKNGKPYAHKLERIL